MSLPNEDNFKISGDALLSQKLKACQLQITHSVLLSVWILMFWSHNWTHLSVFVPIILLPWLFNLAFHFLQGQTPSSSSWTLWTSLVSLNNCILPAFQSALIGGLRFQILGNSSYDCNDFYNLLEVLYYKFLEKFKNRRTKVSKFQEEIRLYYNTNNTHTLWSLL